MNKVKIYLKLIITFYSKLIIFELSKREIKKINVFSFFIIFYFKYYYLK